MEKFVSDLNKNCFDHAIRGYNIGKADTLESLCLFLFYSDVFNSFFSVSTAIDSSETEELNCCFCEEDV